MDKEKIITYWSYIKPEISYTVNDLIALTVAKFYSNLNSIDLVSLNLLDESFNYYYWFICKNTGDLYFVNLNVDGRLYQLQKDIKEAVVCAIHAASITVQHLGVYAPSWEEIE